MNIYIYSHIYINSSQATLQVHAMNFSGTQVIFSKFSSACISPKSAGPAHRRDRLNGVATTNSNPQIWGLVLVPLKNAELGSSVIETTTLWQS